MTDTRPIPPPPGYVRADTGQLPAAADVFANHGRDEYGLLIDAELRGDPDARARLGVDLDAWEKRLVALAQHIEGQFAFRKAEADEVLARCHSRNGNSRAEWFEYRQEWDRWRGAANHYKLHVVARLREVKQMRRDRRDDGTSFAQRLDHIDARLARIEQRLIETGGTNDAT